MRLLSRKPKQPKLHINIVKAISILEARGWSHMPSKSGHPCMVKPNHDPIFLEYDANNMLTECKCVYYHNGWKTYSANALVNTIITQRS